jgi:dolichyl-phosphate-mannose-protein mannosyltransferase
MTDYMKNINGKMLAIVLTCAALFRFWGTFDLQMQVGDEAPFLALSKNLVAYGVGDWKYAPITDLILAGTMTLFGDNPVGWRMSGIVLGTASIMLVYLIARRLYPNSSTPLLAASLLAFDPFHIHFCRTITQEIPVIFFFLLFLYLIVEYSENNRNTLAWAGIALGLTVATKIYFVFAIPLTIIYAFYRDLQRREKGHVFILCLEYAAKLILLPLTIYLLAHILWFGRGHTLPELIQLKSDAYWVFGHNFTFENAELLIQGGRSWEWFLKVFSFGHQLSPDGQYSRFAIQINNPLFRIMVLPAMGVVLYHAIKTRRLQEIIAPALFMSCYTLFFLAKRPMNSYSALVLLPFAYLALAHAVSILAKRFKQETVTTIFFLSAIIISGCYLFPVSAGFMVPVDLYKPILSISEISRAF